MKGIILHGGFGTRLRPLTHSGPKQLVRVAGRAISEWCLLDLIGAGVRDVGVVLGELAPMRVVEYYGDGSWLGLSLTYIYQGYPYGLAHAVYIVRDFVGEDPFVVYLGDNILVEGISRFIRRFEESEADAMVLLVRVSEPQRFGVAKFDKNGRLAGFIEKPKVPPSEYALVGVYFFRPPAVFEAIEGLRPSWRGELEITDALQGLIDRGYRVEYDFVSGWWKDTGTVGDILEANRILLDSKYPGARLGGVVEEGAVVEGRVVVEEGAVVRRGAVVRGPAFIGRGTVVDDGAYVGPYTSVGWNCEIGDVEIENSVVLDNVKIRGVKDRIEGSIIGSSSIIGSRDSRPRGLHLVVGEHSRLYF